MILSRETIIALRARHTAFRIAIDILYPQQPPPVTPQPAIPLADDAERASRDWVELICAREAAERAHARVLRRFIVLLFAALFALMVYAVWDATHPRPVPPLPQGRPIPQ